MLWGNELIGKTIIKAEVNGYGIRLWFDDDMIFDFYAAVRHGRWIGRWIREPNCWYRCSVCGDHYPSIADNMKYNYCPNCGAKMEEQE